MSTFWERLDFQSMDYTKDKLSKYIFIYTYKLWTNVYKYFKLLFLRAYLYP